MQESKRGAGGLRSYIQNLRLFSHNARMVLTYSAVAGLAFGVFRLLFNFYVLSLGGYTELFLGNLTSAQSVASLLISLPAAYIAERYSQKRIMLITGWVSALVFLGLVALPLRGFLILFSFVEGIAMSIRWVTIAPFLMDNTSEEERQYVFSFNFGLMTLAEFVGNQLGGYLPLWFGQMINVGPTHTAAYRLALGSMMLVSALAVGPLALLRTGPRRSKDNVQDFSQFMSDVRQHAGPLTKFFIPELIIGLGAGLMMPFMNLYFRHVLGRTDAVIGTLFGIGALGMTVGQVVGPPLAERRGKINAVVLTQALSIPFLLTMGWVAWVVSGGGSSAPLRTWFLVAAGAYLLRLALMNLGGPVYLTFVLEQIDERMQAVATSLDSLAYMFGWALMPSLGGWLQARYGISGFAAIFLLVAVLYGMGIVAEWIFFRDKIRAERQVRAGR